MLLVGGGYMHWVSIRGLPKIAALRDAETLYGDEGL